MKELRSYGHEEWIHAFIYENNVLSYLYFSLEISGQCWNNISSCASKSCPSSRNTDFQRITTHSKHFKWIIVCLLPIKNVTSTRLLLSNEFQKNNKKTGIVSTNSINGLFRFFVFLFLQLLRIRIFSNRANTQFKLFYSAMYNL